MQVAALSSSHVKQALAPARPAAFLSGLLNTHIATKHVRASHGKDEKGLQAAIRRALKESSVPSAQPAQAALVTSDPELGALQVLLQGRSEAQTAPILAFANALTKSSPKPQAKETLGKLLFLLDNDFAKFSKLIQGDPKKIAAAIDNAFQVEMEQISEALESTKSDCDQTTLQDGNLYLAVYTPIKIATILVTSSGFFNVSLMDAVKKAFMTGEEDAEYEKDILRGLEQLKSSQFQDSVRAIEPPAHEDYDSNNIIRAALQFMPDEPITKASAMIVAVATFLSELRQGPVGSCFATYLGIELLDLRPDRCLADFKDILQKDELARTVNGVKKTFEYVPDIADDDVHQEVKLSKDGKIVRAKKSLLGAPGITRSLKMMGVEDEDHEKTLEKAIELLWEDSQDEVKTFEVWKIIEALALAHDEEKKDELLVKGKYAFSSLTNNPLLRAWESTIAGMAEAKPTDMIQKKMVSCFQAALKPAFKLDTVQDSDLAKTIQKTFTKTMEDMLVFRFDPEIELSGVSGDGHSTDGAFVPYESDPQTVTATGKRIDSPEKFQAFTEDALKRTQVQVKSQVREKTALANIDRLVQKALTFVQKKSDTFLTLALVNYDTENKKNKDPLANWEQLENTPWMDRTGDDNREVMDTYLESSTVSQPQVFTPKDAEDLLRYVLDFAKDQQQRFHYLDDDIPKQLYPVDSPEHAFSLMPEHPTVALAVRDPATTDKWIEDHVVAPGAALAKAKTPSDLYAQAIDFALKKLVPKEKQTLFQTQVKSLKQNLNLQDFRNKLLDCAQKVTSARLKTRADMSDMLDSFLLPNLQKSAQGKKWSDSIVHFADSNWNDAIHDIHFCFFYNPFSGRIQFGQIDDDGSDLAPLSQSEWVDKQQWDFYRVGV